MFSIKFLDFFLLSLFESQQSLTIKIRGFIFPRTYVEENMQGSFVALITPFNTDFSLNEIKMVELIERQIAGRTDGLLPCGTTGETPALSAEEKYKVISSSMLKSDSSPGSSG